MLTAKEVRESTFSRSARGYRVDEIDEYLERVADTIEKLTEENRSLVKKIEILAAKVQEYREDEDSIRAALVTAQRSADSIIKEANSSVEGQLARAKQEADAITEKAQSEAEATLSQARLKAETLVEETKKKAASILIEAKTKADSMLSDAKEGSRAETEKFELMKKKALDFRSALLQLYKEQFEIIKDGRFIKEKADESLKTDDINEGAEEQTTVPFDEAAALAENKAAKTDEQAADGADGRAIGHLNDEPAEPSDGKPADIKAVQSSEPSAEKNPETDAIFDAHSADGQTTADNSDGTDNTAGTDVTSEKAISSEQGEAASKDGSGDGDKGISNGFKINASPAENKFSDLKFGDDYDISKDTDGDGGERKVGFFGRKRK